MGSFYRIYQQIKDQYRHFLEYIINFLGSFIGDLQIYRQLSVF